MKMKESTLEHAFEAISSKKGVSSAVFRVENGDGSFFWSKSYGEMHEDDRYFIASVTKLYITTIILMLVNQGKLKLQDPIRKYLPDDMITGLHVIKEVDYSQDITIKHLISNTSGLPDYFFHKLPNGKTFASNILEGVDVSLSLEDTIRYVKDFTPKFPPGKKGKAAYSDTNYQLLQKIIEVVCDQPLSEVFQKRIFDRLDLKHTYAYTDITDTRPVPYNYGMKKLWVPKYMATITGEGGIVSTAKEVMVHTKSFFQGEFFAKEEIESLKQWNIILPPPSLFYFGVGLEKLFVPRIISPLKPIGEILGFWGQTGSFAFYHPKTDLYFSGTTNQINGAGHAAALKAMLRIIKSQL